MMDGSSGALDLILKGGWWPNSLSEPREILRPQGHSTPGLPDRAFRVRPCFRLRPTWRL